MTAPIYIAAALIALLVYMCTNNYIHGAHWGWLYGFIKVMPVSYHAAHKQNKNGGGGGRLITEVCINYRIHSSPETA